jgi:hypothetical protein
MTFRSGLRSPAAVVLLFLAGSVLGACATASDNQTLAAAPPAPPRSGQPVNTGAYPNINIVPEGQTAQLSDAEASALKAQLASEQAAQRLPGEPASAYIARLKRLQQLGSTHAAAALAEIEGKP